MNQTRLLTRRRMLSLCGGAAAGAVLSGCGGGGNSATDNRPMVVTHASSVPVSNDVPAGPAPTATPSGGPPPPGMNDLEQPDQSASPVPQGTIPEEPAGPYPADGSNGPNALTQDGIHRKDITSSFDTGTPTTAEGVPMTVRLTITDHQNGGAPFNGAAVYLWQPNRDGDYSMYGQNLADANYLRGVQVALADGVVEFTSIFPGAEVGRWPHLNLQIYSDIQHATDGGDKLRTTQIALPKEACEAVYASPGYEQSKDRLAQVSLDTDPVFQNGYSLELAKASGSVSRGYTVELAVPV
jgi:protocatechuate 3,4-dioxygenase beta subunit